MPRGRGSGGGSLADAFAARYGAVGGVKMTYLGKDKHGASVYKFTYQVRKAPGAIASGRGKAPPSTTVTTSRTFAVVRDGGAWGFVAPNSAASNPNRIVSPEEARFGETGRATERSQLIDRAQAKLGDILARGLITPEQAKTYDFTGWSDTALRMWISRAGTGNRPGPSVVEVGPEGSAQGAMDDLFTGIDFGGGGGGGGGGFAGPVYRAPDKRVVEDFVKGTQVSLIGTVAEHLLGPAIDIYMRDHRRNFDSETAEIDPQMSVLEFIRNTREYQTIHKLRPKSTDERDWISQRAQEAQRGGLDTAQIEDFAIQQATIGGDLPDVAEAAATRQFQSSGQAPTLLDNQFRQVAEAMFARVAR